MRSGLLGLDVIGVGLIGFGDACCCVGGGSGGSGIGGKGWFGSIVCSINRISMACVFDSGDGFDDHQSTANKNMCIKPADSRPMVCSLVDLG